VSRIGAEMRSRCGPKMRWVAPTLYVGVAKQQEGLTGCFHVGYMAMKDPDLLRLRRPDV